MTDLHTELATGRTTGPARAVAMMTLRSVLVVHDDEAVTARRFLADIPLPDDAVLVVDGTALESVDRLFGADGEPGLLLEHLTAPGPRGVVLHGVDHLLALSARTTPVLLALLSRGVFTDEGSWETVEVRDRLLLAMTWQGALPLATALQNELARERVAPEAVGERLRAALGRELAFLDAEALLPHVGSVVLPRL